VVDSLKGVFIGYTAHDQIYVVDAFPPENTKIRADKCYTQLGGNAANAALTFAQMGCEAKVLSCVENGFPFHKCLPQIAGNGEFIFLDCAPEDYPSSLSTIVVNKNTGTRTLFSSPKDDDLQAILPDPPVEDFDLLLIDGFFRNLAVEYVEKANAKGVPVVMDADKWRTDKYSEFIHNVDIPICSDDFYPPGCETSRDVIAFFQARGVEKMAITRGEKPLIVLQNGNVTEIPVPSVAAVDTLAAGDIFHGAFCYHYLQTNGDFQESLLKAADMASRSCTTFGIDWDDLLQEPEALQPNN